MVLTRGLLGALLVSLLTVPATAQQTSVSVPPHVVVDSCLSGCGSPPATPDNSPFTAGGTNVSLIAAVFDDTLAALTAGQSGAPRMTKWRAIHFNLRDNAGNEVGLSSAPVFVNCVNCGGSTPVLMADATANPTIPQTASFGMVWNTVTWDRWRGDATSGAWVNIKNASLPITGTFWPTTAGSPSSTRLSDGAAFYDARQVRPLTAGDVVTVVESGTFATDPTDRAARVLGRAFLRNPGDTANMGDGTTPVRVDPTGTTPQPITASSLPLPTGAATSGNQTTEIASLVNLDVALSTRAADATLALVKAKTDNLDVLLSTRAAETTVAGVKTGTDKIPADPAREGGNLAGAKADLDTITTNTTGLALNSAVQALTTSVNQLHTDLTTFQQMQSLNWYGGWPVKSSRPGVPLFGLDAGAAVSIGGFGGGVVSGVGPAGSTVPRVTTSADDVAGAQTTNSGAACPPVDPIRVTGSGGCLQIPLTGSVGASFELQAGTFIGTYIFEYSSDDVGALWSTGLAQDNSNCQILLKTYAGSNTYGLFHALLGNNMKYVRMRVLAYTSGSAVVWGRASKISSVFTVGALPVGQLGSCQPSFGTQIGGWQITLQASQVAGVVNATTTRATTTTIGACRALDVLINITAGGTATGTLNIRLEDSPDGGTTWDDLVSANAFAFGAAAVTQRFWVLPQSFLTANFGTMSGSAVTAINQGSAVSTDALAAGTVRMTPFGDRIRVRETVSAVAGSPVGPTYTINAVCK